MHIIKLISPVWSIRNKASLSNFFIGLVILNGEEYVLMKRKNLYLAVNTLYGEYYIRKSHPKTYKRLSNYLWRLTKVKKDEFLEIKNYFIRISEVAYNGWHLVIKCDKVPILPAVIHDQTLMNL